MCIKSGLDFHRQLAAAKIDVPIIFITAHADISMSVQAMKGGAFGGSGSRTAGWGGGGSS
jgi:FixJ family two-component response regulator